MDYVLAPNGNFMRVNLSKFKYIDIEEDGLYHWKYLYKKKLPNGKWRYYYEYDYELSEGGYTKSYSAKDILKGKLRKDKKKEKDIKRAVDRLIETLDKKYSPGK